MAPAAYPDLASKIVFLTGIGQAPGDNTLIGNGAATARVFVRNGAFVFGVDQSLEAASATKWALGKDFPGAIVEIAKCDVTDASDVASTIKQCVSTFGRIDILVNNVGSSLPGSPVSLSPTQWDAQIALNLKSVYLTCHSILPIMEQQGSGCVVNLGSIAGMKEIGLPSTAYAAAKAAVHNFTRVTAVEYAQKGIRMNTVAPGIIATPVIKIQADNFADGDYATYMARRDGQVPTRKQGTGEDVANAVVWLCTENARYITGHKLMVDGGISGSTGRLDFKL